MKSVLISLRPNWLDLIIRNLKLFEIRKTKPKLSTPFKVYIYCTDGPGNLLLPLRRKVVGEFVCDGVVQLSEDDLIHNGYIEEMSCVKKDALLAYKGNKDFIYAWHISDFVMYEEPKELNNFQVSCPNNYNCTNCKKSWCNPETGYIGCDLENGLKRPPQSWCYVDGDN